MVATCRRGRGAPRASGIGASQLQRPPGRLPLASTAVQAGGREHSVRRGQRGSALERAGLGVLKQRWRRVRGSDEFEAVCAGSDVPSPRALEHEIAIPAELAFATTPHRDARGRQLWCWQLLRHTKLSLACLDLRLLAEPSLVSLLGLAERLLEEWRGALAGIAALERGAFGEGTHLLAGEASAAEQVVTKEEERRLVVSMQLLHARRPPELAPLLGDVGEYDLPVRELTRT